MQKDFDKERDGRKVDKERDGRKVKKDLDVKAQIDAMTFHSGAKMRNITCVMQELGYLDEHLEPNYDRMMERINKLLVPEELKRDMVDGVKFCRQFSVRNIQQNLRTQIILIFLYYIFNNSAKHALFPR